MEKPPRRELSSSFVQSDAPILHAQQPHFFSQERLCQYIPLTTQQPDKTASTIDEIKRFLTKLLWPRLVVIRTRHVLVALMPLLNLAQDGTFGGILDAASSVLSPLGWVLHVNNNPRYLFQKSKACQVAKKHRWDFLRT